jgi:hypothetical protein
MTQLFQRFPALTRACDSCGVVETGPLSHFLSQGWDLDQSGRAPIDLCPVCVSSGLAWTPLQLAINETKQEGWTSGLRIGGPALQHDSTSAQSGP